ncbi:homoserine kinase [Cavenderia fasciculata]|uniref:Homoserine kinase n=1 Tax=Cavenderia fasciculata TaxID=261658 RepID=F4PGP8_CACFS|nr:homoserine kinase [Cavenderia fasciculata]EGG24882.1 homoserine kinase [Cavenderia fasciculata]|eukprot:XP_004362733.1 homoserine kinase [Cavenderia fasciculata]
MNRQMLFQPFTVKVPGTSANLGCGYDTLSLALQFSKEYNQDAVIPTDVDKNFLTTTLYSIIQEEANVKDLSTIIPSDKMVLLDIDNDIPVGRGMGSSAATIVTAIYIAKQLTNNSSTWTKDTIFQMAIKYEPSADNLSSAIFGGFNIVCSTDLGYTICKTTPLPDRSLLKGVVVIPHFQVLTMEARTAVPSSFSKSDVIFNLQRISLLTNLLSTFGDDSIPKLEQDRLNYQKVTTHSLMDKIHQPYRSKLVPGLADLLQMSTAIDGLFGICLSGSGPTVLLLAYDNYETIANMCQDNFSKHNIKSNHMILEFDNLGATITTPPLHN